MRVVRDRGFTTIELMTVIVIASILLVIAIPGFLTMSNRSAVTATTNELVGLLQFTKNNAKIANKPTIIKPCGSTESCSMAVMYAEDSSLTDKNLRVINFPKKIMFNGESSLSVSKENSIAFYADGTRGIHATNTSVKKFDSDGAFKQNSISLLNYATGNATWKISAGTSGSMGYYCNTITISMMGDIAINEGCD